MGLKAKDIIVLLVVAALFILVSQLTVRYTEELRGLILLGGFSGVIIYFLIIVISVVVAPLSTFPLLPVAVAMWGSLPTAIVTIIGKTLGAVIAFVIARKYGYPVVRRFTVLANLQTYEKLMPIKNIFWSIVFLRLAIPLDAMNYIIGILTKMRLVIFALATLVAMTPFTLAAAYAVQLPIAYQVVAFLAGIAVLTLGYRRIIEEIKKMSGR